MCQFQEVFAFILYSGLMLISCREAHTPRGGPDGGDGGRGGSVIFVANPSIKSLLNLNNLYIAPNGTNGLGRNCHGKNGKDIVINVYTLISLVLYITNVVLTFRFLSEQPSR